MEERRARQKLTQALSIDCMETCWTEGYSRAHGWGVVRGGSAPDDVMAAPISEHAIEFSDQFEFGTDADFGWTEERKMKEKQDNKDKKDMTEADERLPTTSKLAWGSRTSRRGAYFFRTSRCQGVGDCGLHPHPMDLQDRQMKRDRECREEISGTFVENALYIDDQSITLTEGQDVLDKNNAPDNVDEPDNVEML